MGNYQKKGAFQLTGIFEEDQTSAWVSVFWGL